VDFYFTLEVCAMATAMPVKDLTLLL